MGTQYFYLVVCHYDGCIAPLETTPLKIFLQESKAVKWGRREAAKVIASTGDPAYVYLLYRQVITETGRLEYVKELKPYPIKELVDAGFVKID